MFSRRGKSLMDCRGDIGGELRGAGPCIVDLNGVAVMLYFCCRYVDAVCALRDMVPCDPDLGTSRSPMRTLADHGFLQVCAP